MLKINNFLILTLCFFAFGCNKNLTDQEKEEMWSKAQTSGEIIRRSGTVFNPDQNKELAMRDAQTRLQTGGGLFGKSGGLVFGDGAEKNKQNSSTTIGMPVNPYLWKATLKTIDFMPLSSTDPFAGTIITDWYTTEANVNQRCKLNVFISGLELKTDNLRVSSFCQTLKNNQWVNIATDVNDNIKLENAILNNAKKLKISSS